MLVRSLFVWLASSLLLFWIAFVTQAQEYQPLYLAYATLFTFPIGVCVYRGALGTQTEASFGYPSISICVVSAWIFTVGPSLIVETPESLLTFNYSSEGLSWARMFFFAWCVLFAFVSGRPHEKPMSVVVRQTDFWSLIGCSAVIMSALVSMGLYSNYQGMSVRTDYEPGSSAAILKAIGAPLPALLPVMCALCYAKAQSKRAQWLTLACFLLACVALFLATSRTAIVLAMLMCMTLGRKLELRPRLSMMLGVGASVPVLLLLVFAYRQTLSSSEQGATTVSAYVSTAADSTGAVMRDKTTRSDVIVALSENVRSRLWYGQQFSTTVDGWLSHGAELRGSFFAGLIRAAPTFLVPDKNDMANEIEFERLLVASGRFPPIDLGPMPWQQWLFELGVPGLFLGALLYGALVRLIDRRLSSARSLYEIAFWFTVFLTIAAAEHTTDSLFVAGRLIAVFLIVAAAIAFAARMFSRESTA